MKKIVNTRNYRLFERDSGENRPLDIKKHKKLMESMKKYGFLEVFPVVVTRNGGDKLIVKDGQHRIAIAEALGLPVYYVEGLRAEVYCQRY
jgi:ParB-like chromosome segregation protein Spo0J